jgi:hypothetical protein
MGTINEIVARNDADVACVLPPDAYRDPAYRLLVQLTVDLRKDAPSRLGLVRRALRIAAVRLRMAVPAWWTEIPLESRHADMVLDYIARHEARETLPPHAPLRELVLAAMEALLAPEVGL